MQLGRVRGTCVATQKACGLSGSRLLVVQPLDFESLEDQGPMLVAADTVQADRGELVAFVRSREAANSLPDPFCPVDAAIVMVVDDVGRLRKGGDGTLEWIGSAR